MDLPTALNNKIHAFQRAIIVLFLCLLPSAITAEAILDTTTTENNRCNLIIIK